MMALSRRETLRLTTEQSSNTSARRRERLAGAHGSATSRPPEIERPATTLEGPSAAACRDAIVSVAGAPRHEPSFSISLFSKSLLASFPTEGGLYFRERPRHLLCHHHTTTLHHQKMDEQAAPPGSPRCADQCAIERTPPGCPQLSEIQCRNVNRTNSRGATPPKFR